MHQVLYLVIAIVRTWYLVPDILFTRYGMKHRNVTAAAGVKLILQQQYTRYIIYEVWTPVFVAPLLGDGGIDIQIVTCIVCGFFADGVSCWDRLWYVYIRVYIPGR